MDTRAATVANFSEMVIIGLMFTNFASRSRLADRNPTQRQRRLCRDVNTP